MVSHDVSSDGSPTASTKRVEGQQRFPKTLLQRLLHASPGDYLQSASVILDVSERVTLTTGHLPPLNPHRAELRFSSCLIKETGTIMRFERHLAGEIAA